jgi:hypothetical protein
MKLGKRRESGKIILWMGEEHKKWISCRQLWRAEILPGRALKCYLLFLNFFCTFARLNKFWQKMVEILIFCAKFV